MKKYLFILIGLLLLALPLHADVDTKDGTAITTATDMDGSSDAHDVCDGQTVAAAGCEDALTALDTDSDLGSGINYRVINAASSTSCSGTQIRIILEAHSVNASIIDGTSVGESAVAPNQEDFSEAPTRITWDTGSSTVTIGAGTTATSDWVNYTWTKENAHLIHIYMDDHGTQYRRYYNEGSTAAYYLVTSDDYTLTQDWTVDGSVDNRNFLIKIEVQ